ncbi:MBL fold metallo-hydrolase [Roseisolibacter agri]|uniref:MBL fold metallo-hydrolase n=1 Tax=Roseisolibacter agri TaxID=2014610 RepID=A0AA37V0C3_9BACT|nr:MBL fold metallo-hydrolase [Roseisolibacter agri]GLC24175.1 MBL fold metallo-hydrolase [Roseisolibacter agri]
MRLADLHLPDAGLRPPGDLAGAPIPLLPDVAWLRTGIVNVVFLGLPEAGDGGWVLVDAGIPGFATHIAHAAARRYGDTRPAAIVLTHGHFDHVGSLRALADRWDVPIYAHPLELPYVTGRAAYPPPDPTVGGGAMARLSPLYPPGPFDFADRVRPLPTDGTVPGAPGWRVQATPGHSPGHVSLVRDADRTVVVGDAFVTTQQESATAVLTQRVELHGPPMYYTCDWDAARESVRDLAALDPSLAITGHGQPMRGDALREQLRAVARDFDHVARPAHGRYARRPAITNESGVVELPPPVPDATSIGIAASAVMVGMLAGSVRRSR